MRCQKSARRCGAKHIFEVKSVKDWRSRTTFGSCDVEKVHAVVARSTFRSQNVQNTPCSRHFWKFGCRKSARCCGAKHISNSKCTKHLSSGPLLEVEMLRKCTSLWREAHVQVKMSKIPGVRTIFGGSDVEKVYAVVARSALRSHTTLHSSTLRYTKLHYTTLHYTEGHCNTDRQLDR